MNGISVPNRRPLSQFLRMAVVAGVESAVMVHVQRGDDLDARDSNGLTPLMLAAARNKRAICKILLDAGADDRLLDPFGHSALGIAEAAGAHEAANVLKSFNLANEAAADSFCDVPPIAVESVASAASVEAVVPIEPIELPHVQVLTPAASMISANCLEVRKAPIDARAQAANLIDAENAPGFDLSDWEPEEDHPPPEEDVSIALVACAIQASITEHEPIDSSTDWNDFDIFLPERSLPLLRSDDAEARERLRLLLLRALREGSVPFTEVEALSRDADQTSNPEAEAFLGMLINDLGAEVDERFEYSSIDENFEVFTVPESTPDEDELIAHAMAAIDSLAARRTEPLRIYQKEFQRNKLISAQEEVFFCQSMDAALDAALDALAAWPRGISLTLAAGRLVATGQHPLTWMSLGPTEDLPDLDATGDPESDIDISVVDQIDEEYDADGEKQDDAHSMRESPASDFIDALDRLALLPVGFVQQGLAWHAVRETMSSLRLNRRFLLALADFKQENDLGAAAHYAVAITAYRRAWEQMAVANLKLVFHLAKKYLYSGEPLDDLTQAGNLGLLKAIDRFDWRRGFKFSTYATWWIRQQIGRHIDDNCRTIRIPVHVHDNARRLSRETQEFESEIGRPPKIDEIAARLGMSVKRVAALQRLVPEPLAIDEVCVDNLIAIEAQATFISPDPMEIVSQYQLSETIEKLLSTLKPKEAQILRLRFGIGVTEALTLDEVGIRYEVTRERIRQIEAKALRKLRHPSRVEAFGLAVFGTIERRTDADSDQSEVALPATETQSFQQEDALNAALSARSMSLSTASASIDNFLAEVAALNIPIVDDRDGSSGRVWVNFTGTPDDGYRRLVPQLTALGFELSPGKGYWI